MNKGEIQKFSNEELISYAMHIEEITTMEANSTRGITKKSIKEYKWTIEEMAKRFNLDLEKLIELRQVGHWYEG